MRALILLAALVPATASRASESWNLGALGAIATEYVDRGISQSDGNAAVHGELALRHDTGFHAAIWGSTVDFAGSDQADAEVTFLVGFEGELDRAQYASRLTHIRYAGASGALADSFFELSADLGFDTGPLLLSAQAIFAPETSGHPCDALYLAVGAARPLTDSLLIQAHLGHQWLAREDLVGPDYHDWGVGLAWQRGRFRAKLAYSDTDAGTVCADLCDARLTLILEISR